MFQQVLDLLKIKRIKAGKQFVDVGIAEEHAVALISGIAKNGGKKPVFGTNATFIQKELMTKFLKIYV